MDFVRGFSTAHAIIYLNAKIESVIDIINNLSLEFLLTCKKHVIQLIPTFYTTLLYQGNSSSIV